MRQAVFGWCDGGCEDGSTALDGVTMRYQLNVQKFRPSIALAATGASGDERDPLAVT